METVPQHDGLYITHIAGFAQRRDYRVTRALPLSPPLRSTLYCLREHSAAACSGRSMGIHCMTYTLFVLLHPVQGRRVTDGPGINNRDGKAVSQLEECLQTGQRP